MIGSALSIGYAAIRNMLHNTLFNNTSNSVKLLQNIDGSRIDHRGFRSKSIVEYTRSARVEPNVIIEKTLVGNEITSPLMQVILSHYAAFYLQAIAIDSTVANVAVINALDKLNPNRSAKDSLYDMMIDHVSTLTLEHYPYTLPNYDWKPNVGRSKALESFEKSTTEQRSLHFGIGLEATAQDLGASNHDIRNQPGLTYNSQLNPNTMPQMRNSMGSTDNRISIKEAIQSIYEQYPLSIGKLLQVDIVRNGQKASIPVSIRFRTYENEASSIIGMLAYGVQDLGFMARWEGWRSGRLSFIKDNLFCGDLIKGYKKALGKNDPDSIMMQNFARKRQNEIATLLSGTPSVNQLNSIYVISAESKDQLKRIARIDLDNFKQREIFFENNFIMLMVVVDQRLQRVKFYYHTIDGAASFGFREVRTISKNDGTNNEIGALMQQMQMGMAPRF